MRSHLLFLLALLVLTGLACQLTDEIMLSPGLSPTPLPPATPTAMLSSPRLPGSENPDEPVFIIGQIPYSSPFFINNLGEPFVMLEDQGGFIQRDREYNFPQASQALGPITLNSDNSLTFELALPAVPQGRMFDLDQDAQAELGVQVFAVAFWSNTWGGPFMERRDGTGWSTAYVSTRTDPENKDEINGGTLIVWAPDENQSFPSGFGPDALLFTADDPVAPISAGYNLVDLDQVPFRVYKEARPNLTLYEGEVALNDFSNLSYSEAFEQFFTKASREYPFTEEKQINWQALHDQIAPQVEQARDASDYYKALRQFIFAIPDGHLGLTSDVVSQVFYEEGGGGFGLVLAELSDGKVIITQVLPGSPAERAGMLPGYEILTWGNRSVAEAITQVVPPLETFSTPHTRRLSQVVFLTRVPEDTQIEVEYRDLSGTPNKAVLNAIVEYDSLFAALPAWDQDLLQLPVEGQVLDQGFAYVKVSSFSDDYNLIAQIWDRFIQKAIEDEIPGLIIDLRMNGGGSSGLSLDLAGYFFEEEIPISEGYYYNENLGDFEPTGYPVRLRPGPRYYSGQVAVLIGPFCASACEGFAYALQQQNRSTLIGHYPTAGMYGEVGQGQYKLPDDIEIQVPTGRSLTPTGEVMIEGSGVIPDILVPLDAQSALGQRDRLLEVALELLQK